MKNNLSDKLKNLGSEFFRGELSFTDNFLPLKCHFRCKINFRTLLKYSIRMYTVYWAGKKSKTKFWRNHSWRHLVHRAKRTYYSFSFIVGARASSKPVCMRFTFIHTWLTVSRRRSINKDIISSPSKIYFVPMQKCRQVGE